MKTIKLFFSTLLVVIISAIGMASCIDDDELKDKVVVITMSVSENTDIMYSLFDDHKENPIECMLFMEDGVDQTWRKMGFSSIEGFTYEKGHRYKLRAKKTILANPPADASAWIYELVEVLEDKEIIGPELPVEDAIKSETDIVITTTLSLSSSSSLHDAIPIAEMITTSNVEKNNLIVFIISFVYLLCIEFTSDDYMPPLSL